MARNNRLWGAERIRGELLKLGIEIAEITVSRCMPKRSISRNERSFPPSARANTRGSPRVVNK